MIAELDPTTQLKGLLIFIRILGIFSVAPVFGHAQLPPQVKVAFSVLLSLILLPVVKSPDPALANEVFLLGSAVLKEFIVGIVIGYVTTLLFVAIQLAGEAIDVQMGFGMASIADPLLGTHTSIMGQFLYLTATIFFLVTNGHHHLLTGLAQSFQAVPLDGFVMTSLLYERVLGLIAQFFLIGLRIGGPVMLSVFLADLALGLLGRNLPQMNLMVIGFPIKVWVGIGVFSFMLPFFLLTLQSLFSGIYRDITLILTAMR